MTYPVEAIVFRTQLVHPNLKAPVQMADFLLLQVGQTLPAKAGLPPLTPVWPDRCDTATNTKPMSKPCRLDKKQGINYSQR